MPGREARPSEGLEPLLRIQNFYWAGPRFQPPLEAASTGALAAAVASLHGQFALPCRGPDAKLVLARDRLGVNKLFFAIDETGAVVLGNYLVDLVDRRIPFEEVYSVPAGHFLEIDLRRRTLSRRRYFHLDAAARGEAPAWPLTARNIRRELEEWFSRLAMQFGHRRICVCLSGGLDSSVIAALAARSFPEVTAYTYGYVESGAAESADVRYARRVADSLGLPLRLVPASARDVLDALDDALCYGQDWREFNVHCAVVNEILARAIAHDAAGARGQEPPLVLTGDVANELLADYAPFSYAGREIYKLPRVGPRHLREALLRGLDAGDREVGVFNHHGLDVIQPYNLVTDQFLQLPASFIESAGCKQLLVREMAGDLLPSFLFAREKARAQIGDPTGPGGIVSTLQQAGRDSRWLRAAFCRRFMVKEERSLDEFIRLGRYRVPRAFPLRETARRGPDAG